MTTARLTPLALAVAGLKRRPFRTGATIVLVVLFAFTLFGGSVLNESLRRGIDALSARLGGDILVVPHGYEKNVTVALLRGEPSTFYFKADLAEKIRSMTGVAAAAEQLFVASLNAGCCSAAVQLVGIDPDTDFVVAPWMRSRLTAPLADTEAIVGSMILPDEGGTVTFFGRDFTVAAKMDRTGTGFDTSVFLTLPAARDMMRRSGRFTGDLSGLDDVASVIIVKAENGISPKTLANDIMLTHALDYDLDVILAAGMISDISGNLRTLSGLIHGLAALLWFVALLTLFIVFSVSVDERKKELSLLRILGARRGYLARLILTEATVVGAAGSLAGVVIAALVIFPFSTLIAGALGQPYLSVSAGDAALMGLAVLAIGTLAGPLAAAWTALSVTRFDVYETLREGER